MSTTRPGPTSPPDDAIPTIDAASWAATPPVVKAVVLAQANAIARLEALTLELSERVRKLEELLRTNSSKPPSSDPPSAPKPRRRGKKSGRRRGGQPGRTGKSRKRLPAEQVDNIVDCRPVPCPCGGELTLDDQPHSRHQVWEIPPVVPMVTEYRVLAGRCRRCQQAVIGELPVEARGGMLGPRAMALVAVLTGVYRLSKRAVVSAFEAMFGMELSVGTVSNTEHRVSDALAAPVEQVQAYVREQPVAHADETGWKLGPTRQRGWLWTCVTTAAVVFMLRASRAAAVAKELLGQDFGGIVVADRYSGYGWIPISQRQICWAHLKRDFQKIADRPGDSEVLGSLLLYWVPEAFKVWHEFLRGDMSRAELRVAMESAREAVRELLTLGVESPTSKTANTCRRILKVEAALWTFVEVEGVEPTNNDAERAIRPAVMWRKTSFGTDSDRGARFVERILTTAATCERQGRHVVDFLTLTILAHRTGSRTPSLIP